MTSTAVVQNEVQSALEYIRHPRGRPLIVALSGGVDSLVLAHSLARVTTESGPELHAVHVDHGLREESGQDAERVQALCEKLELSCDVKPVNVTEWDKRLGQGTESAARAARYAALATVAANVGTDTITTGHTIDDQAETVLLRLMSGSGLEGLGGMDRISRRSIDLDPDGKKARRFAIFRPLLNVARAQIESYAREHSLEPVEDASNESLEFRRNAIRRNVLPAMVEIEPATKDLISRSASLLREDARFISDTVDETFDEVVAERAGVWMIERQQFLLAYQAIQRRILFRTIEPLLPARVRLGQERVESLRMAAVDGQPGKVIELADGLVAYVDYDRVAIGRSETLEDDLRRLSWIPLLEPGSTIPLRGSVEVELDNGWLVHGAAPDDANWVLRTRRDGDRTRDHRGREIKLQDWLVDRKVPRYVRDWLPLVTRDDEIRWIIGLDITEINDAANNIHLQLELNAGSGTVER